MLEQHTNSPDTLRATQRVHDESAIRLMREARRHLRESHSIAKQLARIEHDRPNQQETQ
jgi:hypothetical protein